MLSTSPPMPTFSPSLAQLLGACAARFGLWLIVPAPAIWPDQARATSTKLLLTVRAPTPRDARTSLSLARKADSPDAVSACVACSKPIRLTAATAIIANACLIRTIALFPRCHILQRAQMAPIRRPGCHGGVSPCRPVALRQRVSPLLPFRG